MALVEADQLRAALGQKPDHFGEEATSFAGFCPPSLSAFLLDRVFICAVPWLSSGLSSGRPERKHRERAFILPMLRSPIYVFTMPIVLFSMTDPGVHLAPI